MLDHLKANNRAWADRKVSADPGFFKRLEGQQAPEYW
ncbi:MAG: carbonic anhydrase family protein, partial [Phenylobacterium sp.]|nr:carbonic anhydrase family protein [Phenylobacterium sp.]